MSAFQLKLGFCCTNCSHYVNIIIAAIFLYNLAAPNKTEEQPIESLNMRSFQGREQEVQLICEKVLLEYYGIRQIINSSLSLGR